MGELGDACDEVVDSVGGAGAGVVNMTEQRSRGGRGRQVGLLWLCGGYQQQGGDDMMLQLWCGGEWAGERLQGCQLGSAGSVSRRLIYRAVSCSIGRPLSMPAGDVWDRLLPMHAAARERKQWVGRVEDGVGGALAVRSWTRGRLDSTRATCARDGRYRDSGPLPRMCSRK